MSKPQKANHNSSALDRFKKLTKALVAVPRRDLQEKLDKYRQEKQKAKKKTA